MKNQYVKWIIIALVVIVAIVALVLIVKALQSPAQPPTAAPNVNPASGVGSILQQIIGSGWLKKIFSGGSGSVSCDPSNPGYDNAGNYTVACGGTPGGGGANCDPNHPGYDMNGFLSTQCGA